VEDRLIMPHDEANECQELQGSMRQNELGTWWTFDAHVVRGLL
jgi:hypothetical protein